MANPSSATALDLALAEALSSREQQGLYRRLQRLESPQGPNIRLQGRDYLNFCSNDYLGLANHPALVASLQSAAARWGLGSGASHLVTGHSQEHHALEEALAQFTGRPRALLFSSGYMANMGCITALLGAQDAIFEDRLNHASLLDAGLLSRASFSRFAHNNPSHLDACLHKRPARRKLVVVDGVFSMDGDLAPLAALAEVSARANAWLMVDDAHGLGCLGRNGGGSLELAGLSIEQAPILMGTLGKAFGTAGAFVAGSHTLIESLIQFARSYIYTTALPPALAAATRTALGLVQDEPHRREHLQSLISHFRTEAQERGLPLMPSQSAIQPLLLGDSQRALRWQAALQDAGIWISAIRPPTVPKGSARLRITLTAAHSHSQLEQLLRALQHCQQQGL
jgi:8-amino-7-oxononanoate synthase